MRAFIAPRVFTASPAEDDTAASPFIDDGAVLIDEQGRIAKVGPAREVVDKDATRFELDGVLLPGLIDMHTHLCLSAGRDPGADARTEHRARIAIRGAQNLARHLDAGVTTIRDVGGIDGIDLELARLVDEGGVEGPSVFAAGHVICMTGGHACFLGIEADGPDEVRKATRTQLKAGAALIKLIATGGILTPGVQPGAPQLTEDEMRAACEEAHKASRTVAAHAQAAAGVDAALRAGVDTIEHGFWLSEFALSFMSAHRRTLVPTFAALRMMRREAEDLPEFVRAKLDAVEGPQRDAFRQALAHGVAVATGTDAGTPGNPHGNLVEELRAFAELGMTPEAVWRSATSVAARALGLSDRGQLAVGRRGDLIAVSDAAFSDLSRFTRPFLVVKGGKIVRRATFG